MCKIGIVGGWALVVIYMSSIVLGIVTGLMVQTSKYEIQSEEC